MAEEEGGAQEEDKGFKVTDRRFASRGYDDVADEEPEASGEAAASGEVAAAGAPPPSSGERAPEAPSPPPAPAPEAEAAEVGRGGGEAEEDEGREGVAHEFEMLIAILQTNALAALGLNPQTGERVGQPDPRGARLCVDVIAMVKEKMAGNLSPQEDVLLSHVVSDLQMLYVRDVGIG